MSGKKTISIDRERRQGITSLEFFADIFDCLTSGKFEGLVIDISKYKYIHPTYAVLIAALPFVGMYKKCPVSIRFDEKNPRCKHFLSRSGIESFYKNNPWLGYFESVEFCKLNTVDDADEIVNKILNIAPVTFNERAKAELYSKIYEVFDNAFTHSKTNSGVFCCGFVQRKQLCFSIYDAGIGIQNNVSEYLKNDIPATDALKWAFGKGNSTLNGQVDYTRGAGLGLLEEFIHINGGRINVTSGSGCCIIEQKKEKKFKELKRPILGTLFSVNIKADKESIYVLRE